MFYRRRSELGVLNMRQNKTFLSVCANLPNLIICMATEGARAHVYSAVK